MDYDPGRGGFGKVVNQEFKAQTEAMMMGAGDCLRAPARLPACLPACLPAKLCLQWSLPALLAARAPQAHHPSSIPLQCTRKWKWAASRGAGVATGCLVQVLLEG